MTEIESDPKWKRALWLALKIYAGLCTLLITAYLALVLYWSIFFPTSSPDIHEAMVMSSFGTYIAKEYPKRAAYFLNLVSALGPYSKESTVVAADTLKYLGKPDLIAGTEELGTLVYFYDHPGNTNKWAVYACIRGGKLTDLRFNDATVGDHSTYRAYPR